MKDSSFCIQNKDQDDLLYVLNHFKAAIALSARADNPESQSCTTRLCTLCKAQLLILASSYKK